MNNFIKLRYLILIGFLCLIINLVTAEKRALIVAIGKYSTQSGWPNISSDNDVSLITTSLKKQGFNGQNIAVVKNENATKAGIVTSFNNLINSSQPGDVVVFHFSGHGQQVTDTNGDEIDGLDEALVPYDALKTNLNGSGNASHHLLDDELNSLLSRLRTKVRSSGDVLVWIDACHSGTGARGIEEDDKDAIYRGTNEIFKIPGYENNIQKVDTTTFEEETPVSRGSAVVQAPMLIISACSAEQTNKEYCDDNGVGYGSLSYAISKVMSKNMSGMSYVTFFEQIRNEMLPLMGRKHYQTPQMEGKADRTFMGGKTVNIPVYFTVNNVKGQKISISGGNLAGIYKGAEFAFYPPDTYDRKKSTPILQCKVDTANLVESILTLPANIDKKKIQNAWVFVTKYVYKTNSHETPEQARARNLRNASSASKDVRFRIIPIDAQGKDIYLDKLIRNGNVLFKWGDRFVIEVTNKSKVPVYFQLVDISPNDEIGLIMGRSEKTKFDYYLAAGQTKVFSKDILRLDQGSPLGMETIVLIASEKALDLSPLQTQKQKTTRGDVTEFESWISDLYSGQRAVPVFDANQVFIDKKSFIVTEK